jgi:hypothetical protein
MTTPGVDGPGGGGGAGAESPWARPSNPDAEPAVTWVSPATGAPVPPPPGAPLPGGPPAGASRQAASWPPRYPANPYRPLEVLDGGPQPQRSGVQRRRRVPAFAVVGGILVAFGLVIVLMLGAGGYLGGNHESLFGPGTADDPEASKPPLARLCPPASGAPAPGGSEAAPVAGPRLEDPDSGISYRQLGAPWRVWDQGDWSQGTLGVEFKTGYYFITEHYADGDYLASVLSGKVPATVGDSLSLNLACAGRQVAEDVRRAYYPQPTVKDQARDEQVVVGGRPAWVSTFHLTFQAEGLSARGEQVAVVLVDVGRPDAAVLYISIPDTHKQLDPQIDQVIASIEPT